MTGSGFTVCEWSSRPTKSVYFFDPDGNHLEIFAQEMTPAVGKQYLHAAHTTEDVMKPLDLKRS